MPQTRFILLTLFFLTVSYAFPRVGDTQESRHFPAESDRFSSSYHLAQGEQAFKNEQYAQALRHFMKAKAKAEATDSFHLLYKATYDMGISYFMISENSQALDCYYQAYDIVQHHQLGWEAESKIMNAIAGVYFEENNYEKAEEMCQKCYNQAIKKKDSVIVVTYALDLATLCNKKKQFDRAGHYLRQAQNWLKDEEKNEMSSKIDVTNIERLYLQQRYDEVITIGEQLLDKGVLKKSDKTIVMIYLVNIYEKRGNLKRAFQLAEEATAIAPLRNRPELCSIIAELHKDQGNMSLALRYKDSLIIYTDSLLQIQNRKQTENTRTKIEAYKIQAYMQQEVDRLTHHRQLAMLIIVITLLLLIIALLLYHFQRQKSRQQAQHMLLQIEQEKNERLVTEQKMHETELVAHYQREMMKKEIERKKKELAATTMFVSSRNALITDLLQSIAHIDASHDRQQLNALTNHLKQMLKNSNQQDSFLINFEEANPDFIQTLRLKHPTLSASDVRFLAYIRMGLTMKEIATFMNIEPESCKRRKNRLAKKLELDTSADLYQYVASL